MSDRRVKYTKMALKNALIHFLGEKPIVRITIKEICEEADVNRTTFYAHYADQFDQLQHIEREFIEGVKGYLDDFEMKNDDTDIIRRVERIFEYVRANADLCRVLLGGNGNIDFQEKLIEIIGGYVTGVWQSTRIPDGDTARRMFRFVATGCIGMVSEWLASKESLSEGEMARFLVKMAGKGCEGFYQ